MFLKEVSYAHQGLIYLIKNVIVIYSCDGKAEFSARPYSSL